MPTFLRNKGKFFRGFSTPEVLLSIFVVSIGLVTIIAVMAGSLRYSFSNRDVVIATGLSQEGLELVRNVRDNDFAAAGTGFAAFSSDRHCRIDWDDPDNSLDCNAAQGAASRYYLQYINNMYAHSNVTKDKYSRYIFIDYNSGGGGERAVVRSFVTWGNGTFPANGNPAACTIANSCVFTETFLTAWK